MGQNKDATRCGQGQEKHSLGNIHMVSDVNRKEEKRSTKEHQNSKQEIRIQPLISAIKKSLTVYFLTSNIENNLFFKKIDVYWNVEK